MAAHYAPRIKIPLPHTTGRRRRQYWPRTTRSPALTIHIAQQSTHKQTSHFMLSQSSCPSTAPPQEPTSHAHHGTRSAQPSTPFSTATCGHVTSHYGHEPRQTCHQTHAPQPPPHVHCNGYRHRAPLSHVHIATSTHYSTPATHPTPPRTHPSANPHPRHDAHASARPHAQCSNVSTPHKPSPPYHAG
jgi:hypothetical protein